MKKPSLVLLHGWGKSAGDYGQLVELLRKEYTVTSLDLPGFGMELITKPMNLADYASWVADRLKKEKIEQCVLMGHSFGGRVAIKLVISKPELVSKLVLIDSGGIERKNLLIKSINSIKSIKSVVPESLQKVFRSIFGSADYLAATPVLRETMKNVVNENLEFDLPKIKIPTLIVWGRNDHTTPLWQGELMHKLIARSKFEVIEGDHGIAYRRPQEVAEAILAWL